MRQMVASVFGAVVLAAMLHGMAVPAKDYCETCRAGGYPYWFCVMVGCW